MANRRDYYYRQKVTEAELDAGFDGLETAQRNIMGDHELYGIVEGLIVSQHAGTPDLTVDVAAGIAYSKQGERIQVPALQNVDVSIDSAAITTDVAAPGNSKIVSVFLEYDETLSDPRIDGNGATVFHQIDESFAIVVVQGAEGVSPVAPSLNSNRILLADITRTFGDTQILNAVISPDPTDLTDATGRREDLIHVDDTPIAMRALVLRDALTSLLAALNDHLSAVANKHDAGDIDAIAQSSGGESVTLGSVESQILELLASLDNKIPSPVDQDILPDANATRALGDASTRWNAHVETLRTYATALLGEGLLSTGADARTARLQMNAATVGVSRRTLLFESSPTATRSVRVYITTFDSNPAQDIYEGIEFTINAEWDGTNWTPDNNSVDAVMLRLSGNYFQMLNQPNTAVDWSDDGWSFPFSIQTDATFPIVSMVEGRLNFVAGAISNIAQGSSPLSNTLYAKNMVKAWGHVELNTSGNVVNVDGFNIQTPANPGASSVLNIVFSNALDDDDYAVVITTFGTTAVVPNYQEFPAGFLTTGFSTYLYDGATLKDRDTVPNNGFGHVAFVVLGTDS